MSIQKAIEGAKDAKVRQRTLFKSFYRWYDDLSEDDRQQLDDALVSNEVSTKQLFYALKVHEGVAFGDTALYYHRKSLLQENEA